MYDHEDIDITRELRAARQEPTEEFVATLASRVRADESRRRAAPRMALAFAMTVAALAFAAAFGGVSQAAFAVEGAVSSIVNVGHKAKPHRAGTATGAAAGVAATGSASSSQAGLVAGPGSGGSHQPPPVVKPPKSPSGDQYDPGCVGGYRGKYVACRMP